MLANVLAVLVDGLAYGALLFLMSVGLSVTLGLMGFVNLSHMALAMVGGYLLAAGMNALGLAFMSALALAVAGGALFGALLERGLFRFVYKATHLDQVLLTVGTMLMISAGVTFIWGPGLQSVSIPDWLNGRVGLGPVAVSRYRLFLFAVGCVVLWLLVVGIERTRFGAMVRAAVDDQDVARSLGIPVDTVFMVAFAVGAALASLGGALSIQAVGLDPGFAIKYLVLAILIVVLGGVGSLKGTFLSAMIVGVAVVASAYYVPQLGAFIVYLLMIAVLTLRPDGLYQIRRSR